MISTDKSLKTPSTVDRADLFNLTGLVTHQHVTISVILSVKLKCVYESVLNAYNDQQTLNDIATQ